jgi:hypothetical protein
LNSRGVGPKQGPGVLVQKKKSFTPVGIKQRE